MKFHLPMILPDHVLTKIADPAERRRLGKTGRTTEERIRKVGLGLEREEHNRFLGYLERNEIAYVHSRTDRRTTSNLGVADFILPCYRLAIEFKSHGAQLTCEQVNWRKRHETHGGIYHIVETYRAAVKIVETQ